MKRYGPEKSGPPLRSPRIQIDDDQTSVGILHDRVKGMPGFCGIVRTMDGTFVTFDKEPPEGIKVAVLKRLRQ